MVFDAGAKPSASTESINDCMYTGPPLQSHLWDIMVRAQMMQNLLLADIEKDFLQVQIKPFILGATSLRKPTSRMSRYCGCFKEKYLCGQSNVRWRESRSSA